MPVSRVPSRPETLQGVEAVIDKDNCGSKLAVDLKADGYIILTDGGGIWKVRSFGSGLLMRGCAFAKPASTEEM